MEDLGWNLTVIHLRRQRREGGEKRQFLCPLRAPSVIPRPRVPVPPAPQSNNANNLPLGGLKKRAGFNLGLVGKPGDASETGGNGPLGVPVHPF